MSLRTRSFKMQDDYGDHYEIRDSYGVKDFDVQMTFSMRSAFFFPEDFLRAARHPADSDGRPTAGAQVLARVPEVPWHPCLSGSALHCRVPFSPFVLVFLQKHTVQAFRSFFA